MFLDFFINYTYHKTHPTKYKTRQDVSVYIYFFLYRLGEIPLGCTEPKKRQLKVKNISSIPITIFWHIFFTSNMKPQKFNLLYDMRDIPKIDEGKENQIKLMLTEDHGNEASVDVFQVVALL